MTHTTHRSSRMSISYRLTLLLGVVALVAAPALARTTQPSKQDRQITVAVVRVPPREREE